MWHRKKKEQDSFSPTIVTVGPMDMLVVTKGNTTGLKKAARSFLEKVFGIELHKIPKDKEVPYGVYYFDGTKLYSDSGPMCQADKVLVRTIKNYLLNIEGDNVITSTSYGLTGLLTTIGIVFPDEDRLPVVTTTIGNC
jgi:hypothetical protein